MLLQYSNIKNRSSIETTNIIFSCPGVTHCTNPARIPLIWGRVLDFVLALLHRADRNIQNICHNKQMFERIIEINQWKMKTLVNGSKHFPACDRTLIKYLLQHQLQKLPSDCIFIEIFIWFIYFWGSSTIHSYSFCGSGKGMTNTKIHEQLLNLPA